MISASELEERLGRTWRRIEGAGGSRERVRLVAVTKGFGIETVELAVRVGVVDLGESYSKELIGKAGAAPPGVRWHFLGAIQRRKVGALAPIVDLWHGVARTTEIDEIAARSASRAVLIQVNLSGEPRRNGCAPGELGVVVSAARDAGLEVRGVMGVGPAGQLESTRDHFRWLAAAARSHDLAEVSMGMSDDLEVAVEEGATIVRVGSALFGPRPVTSMTG